MIGWIGRLTFVLSLSGLTHAGGIGPDPATLAPCGQFTTLGRVLGPGACSNGPFSLFNFGFTSPGGTSTDSSEISFQSGITRGGLVAEFGGTFVDSRPASSPLPFAEYRIDFVIDPPPPVILGFEMDLDGFDVTAFRFGAQQTGVSVLTDLCVGALFNSDGVCNEGTPYSLFVDPFSPFSSIVFDGPTNFVSVISRIRVTETIDIEGLGLNALLSDIPEPSTAVLAAAGLGFLALWRRRR